MRGRNLRLQGSLLALALGSVALPLTAHADDDLLFIAPMRVVLKPNQTTDVLAVTNRSDKPHQYKVVLSDEMMNADGQVVATDTFAYSAKRMLRFTPQHIFLAPGQRQLVRVMVQRPEDLPDGDTHTHLMFEQEQLADTSADADKTFRINVGTVYSVAVPVVVQTGSVSSSLVLTGAARQQANNRPVLQVQLTRGGNAEAEGWLTVNDAKGPVMPPRRVRVYHEADQVALTLPLKPEATQPLTVTLRDSEKGPVLEEVTVK